MNGSSTLQDLTELHLRDRYDALYRSVDKMFGWVIALQFVLGALFAFTLSPRTYAGGLASVHPHVWQALFMGGLLALYPIAQTTYNPGKPATRMSVAISQALFSALLIHLTNGRIETHFHVFGSLAFLAMYRDPKVLIVNSAIVAADHLVRGLFFPETIYGIVLGSDWRFLEHAAWVVFEDAFLLVAIRNGRQEMATMSQRQAEVEIAHETMREWAGEIERQSVTLNSILKGMQDCVVMVDPDGRFVHVNPAAERMLGAELHDIGLADWSRRFGLVDEQNEFRDLQTLPLARALEGVSVECEQIRVRDGITGKISWQEVSAEPLRVDDGTQIGAVAVFRDITERREMIEQLITARKSAEQANAAKSEFLSRMSHELRTPLNAILGFGQILRMDELTEDQDESLEQILRAGAHLLKLINEVLDISGIEAGKMTISKEPVDAIETAQEVVDMLKPLAANAKVTLKTVEVIDNRYILADRQRLKQTLVNLVSNAIKYNVPGGEVQISLESFGDRVQIAVADTGIGIPEEKRDRLFSAFERLDAEKTTVEGTGLGLVLTKRLVEAMGGEIVLLPMRVGTCFALRFVPVETPELGALPEETQASISLGIYGPHFDLLMVEDNPANIRLMERVLSHRPEIRLHVAASGGTGLEMARQIRPDLILLDLDLPELSGEALLRVLRSDRKISATPVAVLTADANPATALLMSELGTVAFLTKPFEVDEIYALFDRFTQQKTTMNHEAQAA